jgi:hypothetical protein
MSELMMSEVMMSELMMSELMMSEVMMSELMMSELMMSELMMSEARLTFVLPLVFDVFKEGTRRQRVRFDVLFETVQLKGRSDGRKEKVGRGEKGYMTEGRNTPRKEDRRRRTCCGGGGNKGRKDGRVATKGMA